MTFPSAELTRLLASSSTLTARDDVVAALQAQGATPEGAAALWDWIGDACVLLLPATPAQAKAPSKSKASGT